MTRTTLATYAVLALACLSLMGTTLVQCARLETAQERLATEQTAHNGTRATYSRDKALWLSDQRAANATIAGLYKQANATLAGKPEARKAEASRAAIFSNAAVAAKPQEVADDATSRAVVTHINSAFARANGL